MTIPNIYSKATGPIITKFHLEPPGAEGTKISGHMTNLYMVKTFKNLQKKKQ